MALQKDSSSSQSPGAHFDTVSFELHLGSYNKSLSASARESIYLLFDISSLQYNTPWIAAETSHTVLVRIKIHTLGHLTNSLINTDRILINVKYTQHTFDCAPSSKEAYLNY